MRVLHLSYDDVGNPWVGGGGAVRAHEIYRRLLDEVDVTVLTGRYPGSRDGVRDGVPYRRVGRPRPYPWSRWTYARTASTMARRSDADLIVLDHSLYTPVRLPADRAVGISVGQLAGPTARTRWGPLLGPALARLEGRMLARAAVVSVVSGFLRGPVEALVGPDTEVRVVRAGVDDGLFDVERREADYVLYYGRYDVFQKGLDTLLDAAGPLLSAHPEARLHFAGRGRDVARLRSLIERSEHAQRISVEEEIGPVRRAELFAGALAMAMPSRFEGFGMVAAEAMAAGVPVVAARRDSLPEVVGDAGVLVAPEDPLSLAAALSRLLDDGAERERLAAAARARAREFSWDAVARDHLSFLERIADRA